MPMAWLFGNRCATRPPTYFDIRLENDTLTLPAHDENTSYGYLNGTVILCLDKPLYTNDIKLYLKGQHYANWKNTKNQSRRARRQGTFYRQVWNLLGSNKTVLHPGNYEFPFSISLRNTMPESIDGLDDCYIRYELLATIDCSWGVISKSKMMNVIRRPDFLSFIEPEGIERSWPDKIVYEIQIPGRAYILGDPIQLDFRYIALRKGVYPSSIQVRLVEWHILQSIGGLDQFRHARSRVVGENESSYEEDSGASFMSEDLEEWRALSHILQPPRTECLPSCRTSMIDVEHSLEVTITLRNPDGHLSNITAAFPLSLCSGPGTKPPGLSLETDSAYCPTLPFSEHLRAPPPYKDYHRDQPYRMDDATSFEGTTHPPTVDLNGYMKPPDYGSAICSAIPKASESPCYWDSTAENNS